MDRLTSEQRHRNMSNIKGQNTKIEVQLRKALWRNGIRYRKNYKKLPGKPDIAITKHKIAVFCDSEFFHGKDWDSLRLTLERGKNPSFWVKKIENNIKHDEQVNSELRFLGWTVLRFWGKEILKNTDTCVKAIQEAMFDSIMEGEDLDG